MRYPAIQANQIASCIGKNNILKNVSFDVQRESLTSILGPSGSGKTTLLNIIAGFQPICEGELLLNGKLVNSRGFSVAPDKRNVGMVFQDHALFPHLTVLENIHTGLKAKKTSVNNLERLIEKLHLSHLKNRHPHELSGGQQQRTALARALVADPEILLLDEPFANLNQDLQIEVGIELVDILRQQKTTTLMVTHDQNDAMAISDNIVMLIDGTHIQSGPPGMLYHKPASREVAAFLSRGSFLKARYVDEHKARTPLGTINVDINHSGNIESGDSIDIWLHPEDVQIDFEKGHCVDILQQSWRPLDLLLKVRIDEDNEVLMKANQDFNPLRSDKLHIKLNERVTYSAFMDS